MRNWKLASCAVACTVLWMLLSDTAPAPAMATPTSTPTPTLAAPATVSAVISEVDVPSISTLPLSRMVLLPTVALVLLWMSFRAIEMPMATETPTLPPTPTASAPAPAMVSMTARSVARTVNGPPAVTVLFWMRAVALLAM